MKKFIDYIAGNKQKRIMFFIVLFFSLAVGIPAIYFNAWYVGVPVITAMNGLNLFGDWMNYKGYWT